MKKFVHILIFICSTFCLSAQSNANWQATTKEEVVAAYQKACLWFTNTTSYKFNLNYTSYADHLSNEILEASNGFYKRSANKFRSEAVGLKTIQNEKARIIIDTMDKLIVVMDPGSLTPAMADSKQLIELLKNVKVIRKKTFEKNTTFKIDFTKNQMFESYEFSINESGMLQKLIYFYSEQSEKDYGGDDDDGHDGIEKKVKPRLEVVFSKYETPAKISESDYTDKGIVLADNRKIALTEKYKNYQMKDYRTSGKK